MRDKFIFICALVIVILLLGTGAYYTTQSILNKVLTTGGTAVTGYYTTQEALNLVYDETNEALSFYFESFSLDSASIDTLDADSITAPHAVIDEIFLGDTEWEGGYLVRYMLNKAGAQLTEGEWVMADTTHIEVVDSVARSGDPDTLSIDEKLTAEGGLYRLWGYPMSIANACSLDILGIDENGDSFRDTLILSTDDDFVHLDTKVDSVTQIILLGSDADDSIYVIAIPICGVTYASANCTNGLGVVAEATIDDNAVGKICIGGVYPNCLIDCSSADGKNGYHVEGTSNGLADGNVSPTGAGTSMAIMLESACDKDTIACLIGPR